MKFRTQVKALKRKRKLQRHLLALLNKKHPAGIAGLDSKEILRRTKLYARSKRDLLTAQAV